MSKFYAVALTCLLAAPSIARADSVHPPSARFGCARRAITVAADVTAQRSGAWSDPATWGGRLPGAGDVVTVPAGVSVELDGTTPSLGGLVVEGFCALPVSPSN